MKKIIAIMLTIMMLTCGLTMVFAATPNEHRTGDANGDGDITVQDATLIQKHLAKLATIDEDVLPFIDTDGDGHISITDATYIQKVVAKLIDEFPADKIKPTEPTTEPTETTETNSTSSVVPTETTCPTDATETTTETNTFSTEPTETQKPTDTKPEPTTEPTTSTEITTRPNENVPNSQYTPNEMELTILEIINQRRAEVGVHPLEFGYFYYDCARIRTEEGNRFFSHTRPNGTAWATVLQDYGIDCTIRYTGENIAQFYPDAESVMMGFMNSPGHRENILRDKFDYVAIAVYESEEYPGNYTVEQLFLSKEVHH